MRRTGIWNLRIGISSLGIIVDERVCSEKREVA